MVDKETAWEFADEEERRRMLKEPITEENCGQKLKLVQEVAEMSRRKLAGVLGVSEASLRRLEKGPERPGTKPTEEFMNRLRALCVIGKANFEAMSEAKKEKVSQHIGAAGGAALGVGGALGAVSALGAVGGLSAAGMTSGLAALGMGSMAVGIGAVAAIPLAAGALGYGVVKGIKKICEAKSLDLVEVDGRWEIRKRPDFESNLSLAQGEVLKQGVLTVLTSAPLEDDLHVGGKIPVDKLANAGRSCALPEEEEALAVIDCTVMGSCKNCVVFGREGIYYHNGWASKKQGRGEMPYSDFPNRSFKEAGWEVDLDRGQFVDLSGSHVSTVSLVGILDGIKQWVIDLESKKDE